MADEQSAGGRGSLTLADLMDPHRARGTAQLLAQAIKYGYIDLFGIDYAATKKAAEDLSASPDARLKAAGTKLLVAMAAHDLKLMEVMAKAEDAGTPTEVHNTFIQVNGDCWEKA